MTAEAQREKESMDKVTLAEVKKIRTRLSAGDKPIDIAKDSGVTRRCIYDIKLGISWAT